MPLDQAIYLSGIDKIIGCRGKWIHKFNSTTGELEDSMRWTDGLINESYITSIGSDVYVAGWRGIIEYFPAVAPYTRTDRNIFKINPSTMTVTSTIDVATEANIPFSTGFNVGFRNIVSDGTNIFGFDATGQFYKVDPTNVAATYDSFLSGHANSPIVDMCYTSELTGVVFAVVNGPGITRCYGIEAADVNTVGNSTPANQTTGPRYLGITFAVVNGKAYAVDGTNKLFKLNADELAPPLFSNFTFSSLPILDAAGTPYRVKYSPYTELLYVPEFGNDKVEIVDPATDLVVAIRTGFTDPIDIVCTPTATFAVQNSSVGLLEIEEP